MRQVWHDMIPKYIAILYIVDYLGAIYIGSPFQHEVSGLPTKKIAAIY
jgi:hypothetical protein